MSLVISGATIIDAVAATPLEGQSIWIEAGRIKAIGPHDKLALHASTQVIDARGKYVIPGLMDANVHLLADVRMENLIRHEGRYEELIAEAAQISLRSGLTTVFDTLGPRRPLMSVRDQINSGTLCGSRIFCAGNIVGLDGPFSPDFSAKALEIASGAVAERINALWTENVGPALSWMTPEQVAEQIRVYIDKGVDFIKYASSEHRWGDPTTSLIFSPHAQAAIVHEAQRAGITAQAHATSVESLRVAIEAGCDLIQHCNITGPVTIPDATLSQLAERRSGAVVFPFTQQRFDWIMKTCEKDPTYFQTSDINCRNLIRVGAKILLATDAGVFAPECSTDPALSLSWAAPGEDNLAELGQGHFHWLKAMEQKGLPPLEGLRAATRNIAEAYGKDKDLGTVEVEKIADLIVLTKNPLQSADHYRSIDLILKDGAIVDRSALPLNPILTRPMAAPTVETLTYRAQRRFGASRFPLCC